MYRNEPVSRQPMKVWQSDGRRNHNGPEAKLRLPEPKHKRENPQAGRQFPQQVFA